MFGHNQDNLVQRPIQHGATLAILMLYAHPLRALTPVAPTGRLGLEVQLGSLVVLELIIL